MSEKLEEEGGCERGEYEVGIGSIAEIGLDSVVVYHFADNILSGVETLRIKLEGTSSIEDS